MEGSASRRPLPHTRQSGISVAHIAPTRSRTGPSVPDSQRSEKAHLHKRLHGNTVSGKSLHNSSRHHHQHHPPSAKDTVQSSTELKPPVGLDHLLRRDKKSPESSRRGSGTQQHQREVNEWRERRVSEEREARRRVKPEDVDTAKRENAKREEELRESLKSVEELGMSTTRQLDDTYYAILEQASILRSSVAGLQYLAEESRRMHTHFAEETEQLEKVTNQSLESFGHFEQQEETINSLVSKLQHSKTETDKLNGRLEAARNRVEVYERRENARQANRRKQLHATWGTLLGVIVLINALILLRNHRHVAGQMDNVGDQLMKVGDVMRDMVPPSLKTTSNTSVDPYLNKLFDAL